MPAQEEGKSMRLAMILSNSVVALVTGPYIYTHGLRAGIPLLLSLVGTIIGACMDE